MSHTKKQLEKLRVAELKQIIKDYKKADKDSGLTLSGNKGELIVKILKYQKKLKPKKPKKSKKPREQLIADAAGAALGVIPCKGLKKTKDPKCEKQSHCEWVVKKGCRDKPDVDDLADQMVSLSLSLGLSLSLISPGELIKLLC